MEVEFRTLRPEDVEQAAHVEVVAFYGMGSSERAQLLQRVFPPDWTVVAVVDGRVVAEVRSIPMVRRINGRGMPYATVGPVACLAEHRRRGYVGRLMRLSLERMRERGLCLAGLHTPHDDLYRRYGWERAEGKKRYVFRAKDLSLRLRGQTGTMEPVGRDDWQRLDAVYRRYAGPRNGPLHRPELWWRESVLYNHGSSPGKEREAFVWLDDSGEAQGFIIYMSSRAGDPSEGANDLFVHDMVSLTPDAYLALWQHVLSHDIARRIVVDVPPHDPFSDLVLDPWKIEVQRSGPAMIRVVDVEQSLRQRPYCGHGAVSFTMRIVDSSAPWNDGVWRVEADDGRMEAERTDAEADIELSVNFLAPLFTGLIRADQAVEVGMIRARREEALPQVQEAFAVTHPPYCSDAY